jgi:hypothetical protein
MVYRPVLTKDFGQSDDIFNGFIVPGCDDETLFRLTGFKYEIVDQVVDSFGSFAEDRNQFYFAGNPRLEKSRQNGRVGYRAMENSFSHGVSSTIADTDSADSKLPFFFT